jgi:glycosyltransferase involved in cell wall biosynthesis
VSLSKPHITVYIPSHNYGRYLADSIDSVLRQSYGDWELIVIDDASTDNTPEVMTLYRGHPQISLLTTQGIGLPAVCNLALKQAKGDYIMRLDADDVVDENILLVLGNHLDQHPDVALVFPDYFLVDEFGEIFAHEYRKRIYDQNHVLDMPPNGACTLIRKSVLEGIGGYREDLGAQDGFDLWSRISDSHKAHNVNLPLFYYRRHGINLTTNTHRILAARRQIKRDAVQESLELCRPVTAIIPCRQNYDFTTDLWNCKIDGRSLLEMGIEVCLSSDIIDKVVVACDNPAAEEVVKTFDDKRLSFHLRDSKSTIRSASIVPVLEKIVRPLDPQLNGITVLRYIQTPFVTTGTLNEAITSLVMNKVDSSCGVEPLNARLFRRTPHGLETLNRESRFYSDFDTIFRDSQTFLASFNRNLTRGSLTGASVAYFEVSAAESFFINSEKDLRIAGILAGEND